jgi:pilus assembly protein CpaE
MAQRRAIIVGGAGGPEDGVYAVLQRFGFGPVVSVPNIATAAKRMHEDHFDLAIVPVHNIEAVDLATIEHEIRKGKSTFVIGTATQLEPELILRAMRAGIHEFLVFPPDPKELSGAVDRLFRRNLTDVARGMVVAVYSGKGGLGTTSVALNLAHGFAHNHPAGRVALADLVVTGGDIGIMLDIRSGYDISDLVAKVNRIDAELLYSLLTPGAHGVWVLPAGDKPELADTVDAAATSTIVGQLRSSFGFTVIDCEHHMSDRTLAALDAADRVVLVTQLNVAALRSTQRTLAICNRLGYSDEKLFIVVNRYQSSDVVTPKDASDLLEREVFWKIPNDYKTSTGAINKGVAVNEFDPGSPLARSYAGLSAKLGGGAAHTNGNGTGAPRTSKITQFLGLGRKK